MVPTLACSQEQFALFEVLLVSQRGCVAGIGVSGHCCYRNPHIHVALPTFSATAGLIRQPLSDYSRHALEEGQMIDNLLCLTPRDNERKGDG